MTDTLGSQLKAARLARGLTRDDVAEETGLDIDYLRRIENEYIENPRTSTVSKIASALGCRVLVSVVAVDDVSESEVR